MVIALKGSNMKILELDAKAWLARPLCRRYAVGAFGDASARINDNSGVYERSVYWALGWLGNGECDALGAWMASPTRLQTWLRILEDLKQRGVLRIWRTAADWSGHLGDGMSAARSSINGSMTGGICSDAPAGKSEKSVRPPEAEDIRRRLAQGFRRHGVFESEGAVLDFVATTLQRAERRFDRERLTANGQLGTTELAGPICAPHG